MRGVGVVGLGGSGKAALGVTLMRQLTEQFEVVIWRSLRDAPTIETLLEQCLSVFASETL